MRGRGAQSVQSMRALQRSRGAAARRLAGTQLSAKDQGSMRSKGRKTRCGERKVRVRCGGQDADADADVAADARLLSACRGRLSAVIGPEVSKYTRESVGAEFTGSYILLTAIWTVPHACSLSLALSCSLLALSFFFFFFSLLSSFSLFVCVASVLDPTISDLALLSGEQAQALVALFPAFKPPAPRTTHAAAQQEEGAVSAAPPAQVRRDSGECEGVRRIHVLRGRIGLRWPREGGREESWGGERGGKGGRKR
eukprot:3853554-Rhodomonas_salina.1